MSPPRSHQPRPPLPLLGASLVSHGAPAPENLPFTSTRAVQPMCFCWLWVQPHAFLVKTKRFAGFDSSPQKRQEEGTPSNTTVPEPENPSPSASSSD